MAALVTIVAIMVLTGTVATTAPLFIPLAISAACVTGFALISLAGYAYNRHKLNEQYKIIDKTTNEAEDDEEAPPPLVPVPTGIKLPDEPVDSDAPRRGLTVDVDSTIELGKPVEQQKGRGPDIAPSRELPSGSRPPSPKKLTDDENCMTNGKLDPDKLGALFGKMGGSETDSDDDDIPDPVEEQNEAAGIQLSRPSFPPKEIVAPGNPTKEDGNDIEALLKKFESTPKDALLADKIGMEYGIRGKPDLAMEWFEKSFGLGNKLAAFQISVRYKMKGDETQARLWEKLSRT